MAAVPLIDAVGLGFTVTSALPVPIFEHAFASETDVTVYVFVDAGLTLKV